MERSRATLLVTLIYVLFSRISGAEVEVKIRPGDDVTLYCDRVIPAGSSVAWFRNCSHENQPPLIITFSEIFKERFPRFSFEKNSSSGSYDLLVKNVSDNDLGLYYCAQHDKKISGDSGGIVLSETVYHYGNLSTRLSLTGGDQRGSLKTKTSEEVGGDEVCYASLDLPNRRQKRPKKKRVESSEFSTYSEVKTSRM